MKSTPDNLAAAKAEKQAIDEEYQRKKSKIDARLEQLTQKRSTEIGHLARMVGVLTIEDAVVAGALASMLRTITKAESDPEAAGQVAQWLDDGQRFCPKRRQKARVTGTSTATPSIEAPSGSECAAAEIDAKPSADTPAAATPEAVPELVASTPSTITSVEPTISLESPSISIAQIEMAIDVRSSDMDTASEHEVTVTLATDTDSVADHGSDQTVPVTLADGDQFVEGKAHASERPDDEPTPTLSDQAIPITVKVGPSAGSRTSDDSATAGSSVPHQSRRFSPHGFGRPISKGGPTVPPPGI